MHQRIFGILPHDQKNEMYNLWLEFEERKTPEAKFAAVLDRIQPIMLNYTKDGISWKRHGISKEQVIKRNEHTSEGSDTLWQYIRSILDDAAEKGFLK